MKNIVALGKRIKQYRVLKGVSQEELSKLTGITQKHISNIEIGLKSPTVSTLERIVQALDIEMFDLFKEDNK